MCHSTGMREKGAAQALHGSLGLYVPKSGHLPQSPPGFLGTSQQEIL